uniref:T6PP_N domain-containing protein n=1 Tax=Panagrellus redivivus TaxID=6233 RepID=A0A7E4ZXJ4_PANRE
MTVTTDARSNSTPTGVDETGLGDAVNDSGLSLPSDANGCPFQMPQSVESFKEFMYKTQEARRETVKAILDHAEFDVENYYALKKAYSIMTDENTTLFQREMTVTGNRRFVVNVKDEVLGFEKDIHFLEALIHIQDDKDLSTLADAYPLVDLSEVLAHFYPESFLDEVDQCVEFLKKFVKSAEEHPQGKKPILVTDWDGTMKDYCSQYATNLQPVYSALGMANFAKRFTRLSAVLTAGPLRGPGILDLTALPIDGPILFSGSWGREWFLKGRRIVHKDDISVEGIDALNRFQDEMQTLLHEPEYCQFELVGSGVQKKVDRLTLGVQTVCTQVESGLSTQYQDEIRERMHRVDPNGQVLHYDPSTELEVEVVVHNDGTVWNKADGVDVVIQTMGDTLDPPGRVLICGDTASDLPMVSFAVKKNPEGTMAIFVTQKPELRERVRTLLPSESQSCFVSCPDVIHAAMHKILKESMAN